MKTKGKINRRKFLKGCLKVFAGAGVMGGFLGSIQLASTKGEATPVLPELNSILNYLPPTSVVELRNAIAARKIEEFIAPKLQTELKKKPLIAIVYGGAHTGIETDLKYKWLRDSIIETYKIVRYAGIKNQDLNAVYEIDAKNWKGIRHEVNLF
jgi:hypothetical protein